MKKLPNLKRGDTFSYATTLTTPFGTPLSGVAAQMASQVRDGEDLLIAILTIIETTPGTYVLSCADTSGWPVGNLFTDIQYVDAGGTITSTETLVISVTEDVTR